MATATPLLPCNDLPTWDDFKLEARALWDRGLRDEELVRALSGGDGGRPRLARTPEELEALLGDDGCESSI